MPKQSVERVQFYYSKAKPTLRNRKGLKKFIVSIFNNEQSKLDAVSIIFTSDAELKKINKQFLNRDYYTDIITFNLSPAKDYIIGEVYISCDRVRENATIHLTSIKEELHRVIFHGMLHLCGYNDKTSKEIKEMRNKEDFYLEKYFS